MAEIGVGGTALVSTEFGGVGIRVDTTQVAVYLETEEKMALRNLTQYDNHSKLFFRTLPWTKKDEEEEADIIIALHACFAGW
ncbi:hypothetical protein COT44_04990 [Candidatus Shapirobacteria bacterium CG08_land_8_20_14_0_20_39_18]|uniref:Uncharacterized protein n=1 Tax=Candidatus Shapirobacteria bacterium CG08_land_8_20_14_0_20_39_18 TaxID=1974883 RepID=A0A2M6XBP9_9BACT|nr:MAG: hypothetical protein COT44_04990 [Candidatus Shapirobacteria bacterium CG08_land_8_20_14_0_20_39_18]PIY64892.1 MAG: hypothetical protein COY91_04035 [Candidatus Shapirobacteria bacterium CG_4_10_14_0_8_um_filter_39_15]